MTAFGVEACDCQRYLQWGTGYLLSLVTSVILPQIARAQRRLWLTRHARATPFTQFELLRINILYRDVVGTDRKVHHHQALLPCIQDFSCTVGYL
jgi:hypothetical protein